MFNIVSKRIYDLKSYAQEYSKMKWTPKFIVLHNTASPSIKDRPNGFNENHMKILLGYYAGMGWSGGPHFFVDQANGPWAFNPINLPGVHSPSWNKTAIGVEMLGDYDVESFDSGDGLKIKNNAIKLLADLCLYYNFDPQTIRLHKEDPKTTHVCPGKNVLKANIISEVIKYNKKPSKIVIYRKGAGHDPAGVVDGFFENDTNYANVKSLEAIVGFNNGLTGVVPVKNVLGTKYTYAWHQEEMKLYCVEK